jgi:phasin family protein
MSKKPTLVAPFRASVTPPTVVKSASFAAAPVIFKPAPMAVAAAPVAAKLVTVPPFVAAPEVPQPVPTPVLIAASPVAATPVAATPVAATPVAASPVAASPVAASPVAASPVAASPVAASPIAAATPVAASPVALEPAIGQPAPTFVAPAPVAAAPVVMTPPTPTPAILAAATPTPAALALPSLTQGLKTMMNSKIDFVAVGKDNLEAITASSKIWTAGVQDLTKQFAATTKASFEESVAAFKALTTVKSVKEAIELQTAYSKTAMTKAMAETTKLTEASRKLTEEAMAPITARISVAVGSFSKAA